MKEIVIHGRGGQGSVTAAEILAKAAFEDCWFSQAFPSFGVERRGAPVMAFVRIDKKKIRIRSQIYNPDYVIVQDPTLLATEDVGKGIKQDGLIIVNSALSPDELPVDGNVVTFDATRIALDIIGKPIVNTVIIGAFASITKLLSLESLKKSISHRFSGKIAELNVKAVEKAYEIAGGVHE
jgi:pyruvate ferredoxin oxidoreductase gamma subunit